MTHRSTAPKSTASTISVLAGAVAAAVSIGAIYVSAQAARQSLQWRDAIAMLAHQRAHTRGYRLPALPEISRDTDDIVVVYEGGHTQPISDLIESGTLSDGESGEDYPIVGVAYAGDL